MLPTGARKNVEQNYIFMWNYTGKKPTQNACVEQELSSKQTKRLEKAIWIGVSDEYTTLYDIFTTCCTILSQVIKWIQNVWQQNELRRIIDNKLGASLASVWPRLCFLNEYNANKSQRKTKAYLERFQFPFWKKKTKN